jgi:cell pole-organizing protein PopZ
MLIKYKPKFDHIKTVPIIPDAKEPKSYNRSIVQLMPGTNEVSEDEWAAIKPHIAAEIKSGEIVPFSVDAPTSKAPDKKARTLGEVPARIAKEIVEKCVNPSTLKKWFKEETRDEIVLAVVKRMRKLKLDPDEIEKENSKEQESSTDFDENINSNEADEVDDEVETVKDEEKSGKGKKGGKKGSKKKPPEAEADDDGEGGGEAEGEDNFSGFESGE